MSEQVAVRKREQVIRARLTESERKTLEELASDDGESLSVFLRRLIRQEAESRRDKQTTKGDTDGN